MAFILLMVLIVGGCVLYVHHRLTGGDKVPVTVPPPSQPRHGEVCCGLHEVCEKELPVSPIYYDDEELDRFVGRASDSYSVSEEDEFTDILLSMQVSDIPGWLESLALRKINVPQSVRDSAVMLMGDLVGEKV